MRKVLLATIIILFSGFIYIKAGQTASSSDLLPRLRGYILLQVQKNGESWYVNPTEEARIYMKDGIVAYSVMANLGLGITNSDLAKIPVGVEKRFECVDNDNDGLCNKLEVGLETDINDNDSDNDGYLDGSEVLSGYNALGLGKLTYDYSLVNRLRGRIVLQVQKNGQAWYINPSDGKRYYMPDGEAAYQIMRFLSLGITNSDLERIPISTFDTSENIVTPPDSNNDNSDGDDSNDNILPQCGNNIVETGEDCDGSAPSGYICTALCKLLVDSLSDDDDGAVAPSPVVPAPIVPNPTTPQCGNNIVETGEDCDGSAPSGYTCDSQCNLNLVPIVPAYIASIVGPYQSDVILAQSDVPEGSAYNWKINNQTVESGTSPTIFLAHYDGNTNTAFGESAVSSSGVSFVSSNFSQGFKGKAQYPRSGNLNLSQGTLEMWFTLKEYISSAVFDSDRYIFKFKNLSSKDNFYL
ncbi:MAG: hypothetical protein Q8O32_00375, partial [bacterium]|nr:hypothetical protein [bacterium]